MTNIHKFQPNPESDQRVPAAWRQVPDPEDNQHPQECRKGLQQGANLTKLFFLVTDAGIK
jgi:hypothetical protein